MTSSLFATTVFASFFVVALPHILPCPAPRVALADGQMAEDGSIIRRRRRRRLREDAPGGAVATTEVQTGVDGMARFAGMENNLGAGGQRRAERECPIPKPGGVVGELLGFGRSEKQQENATAQPLQTREATNASSIPR
ncbi:hypothetical protein CMQ_2813 [Grosmannia clavigera kw1407]|uniref:Alpha-mannosyltransferase n=1 Tax=Grosmannia clavigera (strain kw1407 / UAMH 11150) TaxID=655863 RepID=F0XHZ8_GROCL|nr:uncharacterized protein CMQ_2813 [Grosmannia clavigera kw1407]EFX02884.1 hypothetical protein CMQ_2813 [Grosmannia clavigera kw1407]